MSTGAPGTSVLPGQFSGNNYTTSTSNLTTMNGNTVSSFGGSQSHPNVQPSVVVNLCIALQGIFPSRN